MWRGGEKRRQDCAMQGASYRHTGSDDARAEMLTQEVIHEAKSSQLCLYGITKERWPFMGKRHNKTTTPIPIKCLLFY